MSLIKLAEENRFRLNPFQVSTYIFTDAEYLDMHEGNLINNASVLISFVAPISGQSLTLRLKHSGSEDAPLEVTLGSSIIQLQPSTNSSLTIDDITLYPICSPSESESDHFLFEPGIWNDIVIQFRGPVGHHHFLHDVELLDEAGLQEYGDRWKTVVENKKEEGNDESLLTRDYFMLLSIERERRLLEEKRVKWITRRMEMISKETKARFQGGMGVEYRVSRQAVEKTTATKSLEEIEQLLCREQYLMELLLLYEVKEWEQLFRNKVKAFLDKIGDDRVVVKLMREWRSNNLKRLNLLMHAAEKRLANLVTGKDRNYFLESLAKRWSSSISQLFEGAEKPNSISLSKLRREMEPLDGEIRLRMEEEIEDTEFRLKRGSDFGQFDQSWDDDALFECR